MTLNKLKRLFRYSKLEETEYINLLCLGETKLTYDHKNDIIVELANGIQFELNCLHKHEYQLFYDSILNTIPKKKVRGRLFLYLSVFLLLIGLSGFFYIDFAILLIMIQWVGSLCLGIFLFVNL